MCKGDGKLQVRVGKPNIDIIGTFWLFMDIHGYDPCIKIDLKYMDEASSSELDDNGILCIGCGGAGQTHKLNFDGRRIDGLCSSMFQLSKLIGSEKGIERLCEYVDLVHRGGKVASNFLEDSQGPFLSELVMGMLLSELNPLKQMMKGYTLFEAFYETGKSPFRNTPELINVPKFKKYYDAYLSSQKE